MPAFLPWILATVALCLLAGASALLALQRRREPAAPEPACIAFPVFDAAEREAFRRLRSALPDSLVFPKLPLGRFCRIGDGAAPAPAAELHRLDVDFALCSASGRVLAAIDLERGGEAAADERRRKARILAACRVRYLRCAAEAMPSADELQALVGAAAPRSSPARETRPTRRREHLWVDCSRGVNGGATAAWIRHERRGAPPADAAHAGPVH